MLTLGPEDPRTVGGFAILGRIGAGGMGTVYKARSPGGRTVAVKLARPDLAADPAFRARFRAEVDSARRVGGFHTAQVVDADPDAEPPWMATAFIPGRTLAEAIAADGPMAEPGLRALGSALAEALRAIHLHGLVHRDLKPANIVLGPDGPRVLDFGIARAVQAATRLTDPHVSVGTPGFYAPEQVTGHRVGPPADVFALGAVLVHAAGGAAFGEGDALTLQYRAVHDEPDLAAVPDGLRGLVAACLAKEPEARPGPDRLLDALAAAAAAGPPTAVAGPRPPEPGANPGTLRTRLPDADADDGTGGDDASAGHRFRLGWPPRLLRSALWFCAFAAVAAPAITFGVLDGHDPHSVWHETGPVGLLLKAVYGVFLLLSLAALRPYRLTIDQYGIRAGRLRTTCLPWESIAAVRLGPPRRPGDSAALTVTLRNRRHRTLTPPRGGGLPRTRVERALRDAAPAGVVR